ncbi:glycosyltransferase [Amycolatopsis sp. NPDC059657]|uniref:glycosyltransferase n=1 Tax=Amycolatopsis sp. NPDC059657 TaxID=3346899 RepID=UPI00366A9C28
MVPLAWALRGAGHEVLVVTGGRSLAAAEKCGLPYLDFAPEMTADEINDGFRQQLAVLPAYTPSVRCLADVAERVAVVARLGMDQTVRASESWRPDLIVHDPMNVGGLIAAARLGVPAVEHLWGFIRTTGLTERYYELLKDDFDRHGASGLPERIVLDVAPPSMLSGRPAGWSMRYVPHDSGPLPEWLVGPARTGRPRIAITLGTEIPSNDGAGAFGRTVAAAAEVDADFVVAAGVDPAGLGPLPPNVRAERWLPFGSLLTRCTGVVHHGGSGVTMAALANGIPQLLLPDGTDRYANAEAVADNGAGLTCARDEVSAALLAQLVADDGLRLAAERAQVEIGMLPTPAAVAARLEALTR